MEYIDDIERKRTEDGVYADFQPQDGLPLMTENEDPDRWFMDRVMKRAVRLWKGEQVDGSVLEWGGLDANGYYERVIDILQSPCAVMAGTGISHRSSQLLGICVRLCMRACFVEM